jgi:hypothetical protein
MRKSERIALDTFLSDYPQASSYEDIMELIDGESELIIRWEPMERFEAGYVWDAIEGLKEHIERWYGADADEAEGIMVA